MGQKTTTTFKTLSSKRKQKRMVEKKMPKVVENPKKMMIVSGRKTSQVIKNVMKDFTKLKRPFCNNMTQQSHDYLPFENVNDIEQFCRKYDTSHFLLGSNTKKRPNNIVLGRLFNFQMLDMVEFGITEYHELANNDQLIANNIGSKPCLLFQGDLFENDDKFKIIQNMFLDMFRGEHDVKKINLLGLDHAIVFTALSEDTIHFGHYAIQFEKSGQKTPKVVLHTLGPNMTLKIRRTQFATADLRKESLRQPAVLTNKNSAMKNVFIDELGARRARVFVEQQEISNIGLRKTRALSQSEQANVDAGVAALEKGKQLKASKRKFTAENSSDESSRPSKKKKTA